MQSNTETEKMSQPSYDSPPWNRTIKVIVVVLTLLLLALFSWRFQSLIAQVTIAAMLAYILNPMIVLVNKRTKLNRGTVIISIYLLLLIALLWALIALGVAAFQQASNLIEQVPELISDVLNVLENFTSRTDPIIIGTLSIDPSDIPWQGITNQIIGLAEPALGRGGQFISRVASTTIRWIGNLFFVFVISIYIANEIPKLGGYIGDFAHQPGYRKDAERLMREFGRIWSAYLRGQVILGVIIGLVVWFALSLIGVQNALALGLLSGLLEFIPILGPVIGAGAAIVVAFFQPNHAVALIGLQVAGWEFAVIVLIVMFIIQQLENNILVPNVVGEALDMHPLLVMFSVFIGGSIAGILGAILAAPVAATIKLTGNYAWRKMFDLPPFSEPEPESKPDTLSSPSLISRGQTLLLRLIKRN